jgi:hypothetical protein
LIGKEKKNLSYIVVENVTTAAASDLACENFSLGPVAPTNAVVLD